MNSFIIKESNAYKIICFLAFVIFGVVGLLSLFDKRKLDLFGVIIDIIIFATPVMIGIYLGCCVFHNVYLTLEFNSILLKKIALLRTKNIVYNMGDLDKAAIFYKCHFNKNGYFHMFKLYFIQKSGQKEEITYFGSRKIDIDLKGAKYFIDLINNHIQKNMK